MLMAMENLFVAQHHYTLHYARNHSGAYRPQLRRFRQGDYVYLRREVPTTLNVRAGRILLWVKEVMPNGLLLLKGCDSKECCEHSKNCVPCHLPM